MDNTYQKKILRKLKKGKTDAFEIIYKEYYNTLCIYVLNFTNDKMVVEDIVQDVLMKLWQNRTTLVIHTSLKSYLYKASYFKFIDYYRNKKRIDKNIEEIRYSLVNSIVESENLENEERVLKLRKAIEGLPNRCKEIFLMSKYEGYEYNEIAQYFGISPKTVENQIGIAYATLKKLLTTIIIYLIVEKFVMKSVLLLSGF